MTEGRGLLTETEREAIAGERSDSYRYKTRAYFRNRLEEVEKDVEVLNEHAPELLEDLQATVCDRPAAAADNIAHKTPETPPDPTDDLPPAEDTRRDSEPAAPRETAESVTDTVAAFEAVDSVDVPGSGAKADRRREAVGAALEYIRGNGEATPADLRDDVYPDYTGDYTRGDDPAHSWWKNCVYPALRQIAEDDDRLQKADTTGRWSWTG